VRLLDRGRSVAATDANGLPLGGQARLATVDITRALAQPRDRDVVIAERKRQRVTDDLELLGTDLGRSEVIAGETLDLAVVWHATRDVSKIYESRLRVLGPGDKPWGQVTLPTAGSANATSTWERNDIFKARYGLPLDRGAGPGEGRIVLELWEAGADRAAGRIELGRINVR
jgi:hypothetical protein